MQQVHVHSLAKYMLWKSLSFSGFKKKSDYVVDDGPATEHEEEQSSQKIVRGTLERSIAKEHEREERAIAERRKKKVRRARQKDEPRPRWMKAPVRERSKVFKEWKQAKREKRKRSSSSFSSPNGSSDEDESLSQLRRRKRERTAYLLLSSLTSLVASVDEMLDQLAERKLRATARGDDVDKIVRMDAGLKPLRLQILQLLEAAEEGREGEDELAAKAEQVMKRFLFLQSQFEVLFL